MKKREKKKVSTKKATKGHSPDDVIKANDTNTSKEDSDNKDSIFSETIEKEDEKKTRTSKAFGTSRKKISIDKKKQKDRDYQKEKYNSKKKLKEEEDENTTNNLKLSINAFCCMPLDILCQRFKTVRLSQEEREAWTAACTDIIDEILPYIETHSKKFNLALVFLSISMPRFLMYLEQKKNKQAVGDPGAKGNGQDVPGEKTD